MVNEEEKPSEPVQPVQAPVQIPSPPRESDQGSYETRGLKPQIQTKED